MTPVATIQESTTKRSGHLIKSSFVLAMALFVVFNALLSFYEPISFDLYKYPYKGWAWWLMQDLKQDKEVHNIALLGSSVMVSAVAAADANYLNKNVDLTNYHRAAYLDHRLRTRYGGTFSTFNLSAPGQMPSDAYLALKAMVNCAHRPDVVVYGIFPRDFIDSTLSSPADTEPFKYLRRLVNIDDVYAAVFRSPFTKFDWWLQRVVYLYGFSMDFQMAAQEGTENFLAWAIPKPFNNPPFTWWDRVRLLPSYKAGEVQAEAVITPPMDRQTAAKTWRDNTFEYTQRYKSPDIVTYVTQINFLKQIARYCRKEGMELVVVNMPITGYNIGMLRPGIYNKYVQAMKEESIRSNFVFYDLCDLSHYQHSDYTDPVHLNAFGGKKFLDKLVDMFNVDQRVSSAMDIAGQELARRQAIAASSKGQTY